MTMGSEFLIQHRKQVKDYNQIRKEVKQLIESNSKYKLKNIRYDGLCEDLDNEARNFAWFVELMDYHVSLDLVYSLHNYFGGDCFIATENTISNGGITIIFVYTDIKYVRQNWEDEVIK